MPNTLGTPTRTVHELGVSGLILTGAVGAALGCLSFGWYRPVTSCFDEHNNETGGATRIEEFKQIVRIRLTRDALHAWVIGFENPVANAADLEFCVIDEFELHGSDSRVGR